MKLIKRILKTLAVVGLLLLALLAGLVTTPDTTPLHDTGYYKQWKAVLDSTQVSRVETGETLYAGWSKVGITPDLPGPMAGYGKRRGKPYTEVLDSVFVRTIFLKNESSRAAIISADLLIIPPTVIQQFRKLLTPSDLPFESLYFGATHTHNSVGGWGKGISGLFFSGPYNAEVEKKLAEAMLQSLREAQQKPAPVRFTYKEGYDHANITNRLIGDKGTTDPEIRAFELSDSSGRVVDLVSYGAHSTVLSSKTMALSRDWPGVLLDSLEQPAGHFAVYLAGAVGSMAPNSQGRTDIEAMAAQGNGVLQSFRKAVPDSTLTTPVLNSLSLPLPLGDPNPRLTTRWALRSWAFNRLFGEYPQEIKALRIGNVLMVGVPCDFSGELVAPLDQYARKKGLNLMVTSFNGGYTGYVTDDRWYNLDKYETVTMNWFGPYKGAYFQEVIKDIIDLLQ